MRSRKRLAVLLLILCSLLGYLGWQRWEVMRVRSALHHLTLAAGVTMLHYHAEW